MLKTSWLGRSVPYISMICWYASLPSSTLQITFAIKNKRLEVECGNLVYLNSSVVNSIFYLNSMYQWNELHIPILSISGLSVSVLFLITCFLARQGIDGCVPAVAVFRSPCSKILLTLYEYYSLYFLYLLSHLISCRKFQWCQHHASVNDYLYPLVDLRAYTI